MARLSRPFCTFAFVGVCALLVVPRAQLNRQLRWRPHCRPGIAAQLPSQPASQPQVSGPREARVLGENEDVKIWIWKKLDVKFDTGGWKLSLGVPEDEEIGMPIVAFVALYGQKEGKAIKIGSANDMKKLRGISIKSEKAALDFVRLFTMETEDIYSIFSPQAVERDSAHTSVVREGGGFIVKRKLLLVNKGTPEGYPLYEVEERITGDGIYSIKTKRIVRRLSPTEAGIRFIE
jgi:hypothetical protein